MDITALENELKAGKLNNIYLLYGEERFLLDNNVKKIKKLFGETVNGINYIQIDNTNVSEIIADIETPAFGYPQKLIVAKDTGLFQKPKRGKSATTEEKTSKKDPAQPRRHSLPASARRPTRSAAPSASRQLPLRCSGRTPPVPAPPAGLRPERVGQRLPQALLPAGPLPFSGAFS